MLYRFAVQDCALSFIFWSDIMYRVVRKARTLHYGDATDCMLKLVELGNFHSSKCGVFEMASDKGGRLEILYWSGSFSSLFVDKYNDFVLIDGTHKTNIYDLNLIVTTTVGSLDISVPVGFLLALSENSASIEDHLDYLKIGGVHSYGLHGILSCSIMTDDESTLVKVASLISCYNHCLCSFHVNQLAVRVNSFLFLYGYTLRCLCTYISLTFENITNVYRSLSRF